MHRNTVDRLWERADKSMEKGSNFMDISLRKTNRGQNKKEIDLNDVIRVSLDKRGIIRSTAAALSIPKFTLYKDFHQ